jgi:membrane-associated phospholipid phosphatase
VLHAWTAVTHTGAMSVTSLAAIVIGMCLYGAGERARAVRWCLLFGTVLAVVLVSKVLFIGWGVGIRSLDFIGFSGHAARAAVVMPVLGWLIWQRRGALAGMAWAVLVAVSRVVLETHSVSEAVSGCALGLLAAALAVAGLRGMRGRAPVRPLMALCLVVLAPLPGPQYRSGWSTRFVEAVALTVSGHAQPYTRQDLTGFDLPGDE